VPGTKRGTTHKVQAKSHYSTNRSIDDTNRGKNKRGSTASHIKKIKLGIFVMLALGLMYIPMIYNLLFSKHINTSVITNDIIEDTINVEACIVRNEEVIKSPAKGQCILTAEQGAKIASQFRLATILKEEAKELQKELEALEVDIIKRQLKENNNKVLFSSDIEKMDSQIKEKITGIVNISTDNNISDAGKIKKDLDYLILKRADIIGGFGTKEVYLNTEKEQREKLVKGIEKNKFEITSNAAGLFSMYLDGYEEVLHYDSIYNLTPDILDTVEKDTYKSIEQTSFEVEEGQPIAKIVKDLNNYLVFYLAPGEIGDFIVDKEYEIVFVSIDKRVKARVVNISPEIQGHRVVTMKYDRGIVDTLNIRKTSLDIVINSYSGLKIPVKSLRNINTDTMTAEIARVKANEVNFVRVQIIGMNDNTAIIGGIDGHYKGGVSLFDIYVSDPKRVEEGQLIE